MTTRRGAAMPGALLALAATIVVTGALTQLVRTELGVTRSRGAATGALAAADGCAARATSVLPAGWDLAPALLGPDGIAATPDDGLLVAPPGCTVTVTPAPGAGAPPARLLAEVDAVAGPGRRTFTAVVGRPREAGVRALVWLADPTALGAVGGSVELEGNDPRDPFAPAWASLGAPADPSVLDGWLAAEAGRIAIGAQTDAPIVTPAPPLTALAARVRAVPHGGAALAPPGPPPAPSLSLVDGDFAVGSDATGSGLFIVDGTLVVGASLEFTGVLVATRGVDIAAGARLVVRGALWVESPLVGSPLRVDGQLVVRHDAAAMAVADVLHVLPRRAAILGVRDHG